jgi:hypothetical protein
MQQELGRGQEICTSKNRLHWQRFREIRSKVDSGEVQVLDAGESFSLKCLRSRIDILAGICGGSALRCAVYRFLPRPMVRACPLRDENQSGLCFGCIQSISCSAIYFC